MAVAVGKLLLLFILVPAIELVLLIQLGSLIGILPTLAVIVITGFLGAGLARHQGLGVLRQVQSEIAAGRLPAHPILDGVLILVAGALLMTPGFLTDLAGFLFLIPASRVVIKQLVWRRLERAVKQGNVRVFVSGREG
jgi:UPF0716 protein FxsA